jgi:acetyl-CoA carboxylase carboxyltransferase component
LEDKIKLLQERRRKIELGGGDKRIADQHRKGKKTARERLALLLDPGSFAELDVFVQAKAEAGENDSVSSGEGVVTGYGTIDGRPVYIYAQDYTVAGGALGEAHAAKICKVLDLALKTGVPCIGLNDSGGARIQEGVRALNGFGEIFYRNTLASGVIPQISVIMGPCTGGAVYSPALCDFVFMVEKTGHMFVNSPQVIKAVTGENITVEELGDAMRHNQTSGVAHFQASDEEDCFQKLRKLLSFLPANNLEEPPVAEEPALDTEELIRIPPDDPDTTYDVRDIIRRVVDGSDFFEIQEHFAANAVVGFARLGGRSVGIVANQAKVLAGVLDIDSADKIARFVRFCDCFNLPLVTFVDVPGYLPGVNQEHSGIIRHGAKVLFAYAEATVPKLAVILRKAYGGAYIAMSSRSLGGDLVFAWPGAEIAVMRPEGAANIISSREIEAAADPAAEREKRIREYRERYASPYFAAANGFVDAVIDPRETRHYLLQGLSMLAAKQEDRPRKKHGNMPL